MDRWLLLMVGSLLSILLASCSVQTDKVAPDADVQPLNTLILQKEPLSADEQAALFSAMTSEYYLRSNYDLIIRRFTSIRPFPSLLLVEKDNVETLKIQFERYNLPLPKDNSLAETHKQVNSFETALEACESSLALEKDKLLLYDDLLDIVDNDDLTNVFDYLKGATQKNIDALGDCS